MKRYFFILPLLLMSTFSYAGIFKIAPNDATYEYPYPIPNDTYHQFCKNVYSQNGEDGILEQLLNELNIDNGTFCEFGASNGIDSSNTYNLIKNRQFTGIAIEADKLRYLRCKLNYKKHPGVQVFHGAVLYNDTENDLNAWLKRGNLPLDLDVLSIDIDGDDYFVWDNLTDFQPKIVILEINSYRDPVFDELPNQPSDQYNLDPLKEWCPSRIALGCSFISGIKLGLKKGYIPVSFTGNITFVRKDLVDNLKEFPYVISDNPYDYIPLYSPLSLWGNIWYTNTGLILNKAIGDYYLECNKSQIDVEWLNNRMDQIIHHTESTSSWSFKDSQAFFAESIPMNDQGKFSIPSNINHIKIDIGLSWCAPMSQVWLSQEQDLCVFAFEPNEAAINSTVDGSLIPAWWTKAHLGANHPLLKSSPIPSQLNKRLFIIPCALGISESRTTDFYITEGDIGCSSVYEPVKIGIANKTSVNILKLADFFDHFPFDTHPLIDYIKIDAQGADLDIVKSGDHYLSKHVVCITIEAEDAEYKGTHNSINEIENYMQSIGFQRYSSMKAADPTFVNTLYWDYFVSNNELNIFQF